jgi:hypothetical protein
MDSTHNENDSELAELAVWQKQIIDKRLNDYYQNPGDVMDLDKTLDDIENSL